MEAEIRAAWQRARTHRQNMMVHKTTILLSEETAISDLGETYHSAKNNDVRRAMVRDALSGDEEYQEAARDLRVSTDEYKLAMIDVAMLRDVVRAQAAGILGR